jgi:hypothetical protein
MAVVVVGGGGGGGGGRVFRSLQPIHALVSIKKYKRIKKRRTNDPNDTSGVVWARFRGSAFHLSPRRVYRRLQSVYAINHLLVSKKERKKLKDVPMAQTTRLASFEPVYVAAAQPSPSFKISIEPKQNKYPLARNKKKHTKEKKTTYLWPKRRVWRRLGPFLPPSLCLFHRRRRGSFGRYTGGGRRKTDLGLETRRVSSPSRCHVTVNSSVMVVPVPVVVLVVHVAVNKYWSGAVVVVVVHVLSTALAEGKVL